MADSIKQKILIVDDEPNLRAIFEYDFKKRGFEVFTAENGLEALSVLQSNDVEFIISDVRMPKMDGVSFLKQLRKVRSIMPVFIFITGFADIASEEAYDLGADFILSKPFNRQSLLGCLELFSEPREKRWVCSTGDSMALPETEIETRTSVLGRWGVFLPMSNGLPRLDEIVRFKTFCEGLEVSGTGKVRWIRESASRYQRGVGVEFICVDDSSRQKLIELIDRVNPVASIPLGE